MAIPPLNSCWWIARTHGHGVCSQSTSITSFHPSVPAAVARRQKKQKTHVATNVYGSKIDGLESRFISQFVMKFLQYQLCMFHSHDSFSYWVEPRHFLPMSVLTLARKCHRAVPLVTRDKSYGKRQGQLCSKKLRQETRKTLLSPCTPSCVWRSVLLPCTASLGFCLLVLSSHQLQSNLQPLMHCFNFPFSFIGSQALIVTFDPWAWFI